MLSGKHSLNSCETETKTACMKHRDKVYKSFVCKSGTTLQDLKYSNTSNHKMRARRVVQISRLVELFQTSYNGIKKYYQITYLAIICSLFVLTRF